MGSVKTAILKFRKLHGKTPVLESFLITLQAFSLQGFKRQTPTQVLSCEVSKTFKSVYFEEHLQTTASGGVL